MSEPDLPELPNHPTARTNVSGATISGAGWTQAERQVIKAYALSAIAAERARADALKTVMIAAAEEIAAHWEAHCDADGYGPQNLLRRLEEGIPSEYGYTAGAFKELKNRADALEASLRDTQTILAVLVAVREERHSQPTTICRTSISMGDLVSARQKAMQDSMRREDAAYDAARALLEKKT